MIPVDPDTKRPLIQWREFTERRASEEELRSFWSSFPSAGIGVVTGRVSGLVVVDVDSHRGGDVRRVMERSPTKLVQRTPSGGYHLLYSYPASGPVKNRVDVMPGVDIRGDGGYVVVAPSSRSDGSAYAWYEEGAASPAQGWMLGDPTEEPASSSSSDRDWLVQAMAGVAQGGRDDTATRLAGYLHSKQIPPDVILSWLSVWNQRNKPPLTDTDLRKVVDSVKGYKVRTPALSSGPWLSTLESLLHKYGGREEEWTAKDWMPRSTIGLMVSPPGTYKTWLTLDLAVSVATGSPFLGSIPVDYHGPVLMFPLEDAIPSLVHRLGLILGTRLNTGVSEYEDGWELRLPGALPIFVHEHRELNLENSASMERLVEMVGRHRPALVVLDPLYMLVGADSATNYMAGAAQAMGVLKDLRDRYGCSFMIAHHTRKTQADQARLEAWGSQFLNAFLETGWQIRPVTHKGDDAATDTIRVVRHFKHIGSLMEPAYLRFEIGDEYHVRVISEAEAGAGASSRDNDIATVAVEGHSIRRIAEQLKMGKSTVQRRIQAMIDAGRLIRKDGKFTMAEGQLGLDY